MRRAVDRGLLGAIVKRVQCANEIVALLLRKGLAIGALAPGRQVLVEFEAKLLGNCNEGVLVGRMQPAAADVEHDVGRGQDGMRPPADAVARFQHDC